MHPEAIAKTIPPASRSPIIRPNDARAIARRSAKPVPYPRPRLVHVAGFQTASINEWGVKAEVFAS